MSLIFELRLMFLSLHIVCSFANAAIDWAILFTISGFEPCSLIVAPRYLNAVTSSSFVSPTLTPFVNPPFLLHIILVFSALISIPADTQALSIRSTKFLHEGTVSIGGRNVTNLRFADDIDGLGGTENELINLVEQIDKACVSAGMEISAEKTKIMCNK